MIDSSLEQYRSRDLVSAAEVVDFLLDLRLAAINPDADPEMRCPSLKQVHDLADGVPERYRALIYTAALAGLRWGELAGLRRRRGDLLHRTITVAEQLTEVNGRLDFGAPKTEASIRTVVLPAVAVDALDAQLARWAEPGADGLVFPAPEGGPMRRSNFRRRV